MLAIDSTVEGNLAAFLDGSTVLPEYARAQQIKQVASVAFISLGLVSTLLAGLTLTRTIATSRLSNSLLFLTTTSAATSLPVAAYFNYRAHAIASGPQDKIFCDMCTYIDTLDQLPIHPPEVVDPSHMTAATAVRLCELLTLFSAKPVLLKGVPVTRGLFDSTQVIGSHIFTFPTDHSDSHPSFDSPIGPPPGAREGEKSLPRTPFKPAPAPAKVP